jgi:hypothetical protein
MSGSALPDLTRKSTTRKLASVHAFGADIAQAIARQLDRRGGSNALRCGAIAPVTNA